MIDTNTTRRISVTETAKLIRSRLKKDFPGIKFSVRSSKYTGGASIDVLWTDGPSQRIVEPIIHQYSGANFDGMIDLQTYVQTWLLPDGSVQLAYQPNTGGSISEYVSDAPHPDAELVSLGADYVFGRRTESNHEAQAQEAENMIRSRCKVENERFGNDWIGNLAHRMVRDWNEGESLEESFKRVILRES